MYADHKTPDGHRVTKDEADYIMMRRAQQTRVEWNKPVTWLKYPISWERWLGLSVIFKHISTKHWSKNATT